MTSGMKSSEFWMMVIVLALKIFGAKFGVEVPDEAVIGAGAYAGSRAVVKYAEAKTG